MRIYRHLAIFLITTGVAFADSYPSKLDFLKGALDQAGIKYRKPKIAISYDPLKYSSQVLQYLDDFEQFHDARFAWAFYRFQFVDEKGVLQDCTAGIGSKHGFDKYSRHVAIEACNKSVLSKDADTLVDTKVTLPPLITKEPPYAPYREPKVEGGDAVKVVPPNPAPGNIQKAVEPNSVK